MPELEQITPWLLPALFGLLWLLIALGNISALVQIQREGGSTSLVLFIGGIFGVLALATAPVDGVLNWFWVPLLLDPGSLFAAGAMLVAGLRGGRKAGRGDND